MELILEAYEEHGVVKKLIEEIKDFGPEDENFDAKFKVIQESVKHHIKEEENELFPKAKKALGDRADEIGDQMEERKIELMQSSGMAAHGKLKGIKTRMQEALFNGSR